MRKTLHNFLKLMPHISSQPDKQVFEINPNETVLLASLQAGIPHAHACGGNARCSTCRVLITEGLEHCAPRNALEETLSVKLGFSANIRLACQTKVGDDIAMRRLILDSEDERLAQDQVKLGKIGEEKSLAILFSDIYGFTKLSESMLPFDIIYVLNSYFRSMSKVVERHQGEIDSFAGDGFMALFGQKNPEQAAENAVKAALDMIKELDKLNSRIELLFANPIRVRIGIHYGNVVLGTVGTHKEKKVTAIGDAVNFASRIESANKKYGTTILVSSDVYEFVCDQARVARVINEVEIRGKSGTYVLYEITGIKNGDFIAPYEVIQNTQNNFLGKIWQLLLTKIF